MVSPSTLMLFMSYLRHKGLKSTTISSYVSEVRYMAKLHGYPDPGNDFLVALSLAGLAKLSPSCDARLPITIPVLQKLMSTVSVAVTSHYERCMLKAMLSLAFFAFLRVGEFTVHSYSSVPVLTIQNVILDKEQLNNGLSILFTKYKHSSGSRPFLLQVPRQENSSLCPVSHMATYLSMRSSPLKAIFIKADGHPVRKEEFRRYLNILLRANSLDPSLYKSHSLRIGAASYASQLGYSDSQIRTLGRWKSDAFKKYIRNSSFV